MPRSNVPTKPIVLFFFNWYSLINLCLLVNGLNLLISTPLEQNFILSDLNLYLITEFLKSLIHIQLSLHFSELNFL